MKRNLELISFSLCHRAKSLSVKALIDDEINLTDNGLWMCPHQHLKFIEEYYRVIY